MTADLKFGLPSDSAIVDTGTVAEAFDPGQVDHDLAFAAMLRQRPEDWRGVAHDQNFGVIDDGGEIVHEQRGDMRDLALNVLFVGADQASQGYCIVVDPKVQSLA